MYLESDLINENRMYLDLELYLIIRAWAGFVFVFGFDVHFIKVFGFGIGFDEMYLTPSLDYYVFMYVFISVCSLAFC